MDIISFNEGSTANGRIENFIENPDSTSGIVTVPSTIAAGETITIPAGRTAILPDVVIEGDLILGGTAFIPTGSTYTQETIKTEAISNVAGSTVVDVTDIAKSSVVTPALALKANTADLKEIGVGQNWKDVTASRVAGSTYTNTTGKPIMISIRTTAVMSAGLAFQVNGQIIANPDFGGSVVGNSWVCCIVPNGATYSENGGFSIDKWFELS